jgi:hypothetical protein
MPQDVIAHVHMLAQQYPHGLEFGHCNMNAMVNAFDDANDSDDESYHPDA